MISENDLIDADFDDLSDADIVVLLVVSGGKPISKTRLQRLSLIVHELYGMQISFYRGYSDEIDESVMNLTDKGIMSGTNCRYSLTDYGVKLYQYILDEYENEDLIRTINNIKSATSQMHDKNIVGLTHHFYNDAYNPKISESCGALNRISFYDGIPLNDYNISDFEIKLRTGIPIHPEIYHESA